MHFLRRVFKFASLKEFWSNVGEDVEKREPWYTVGGNVNWFSHYGKQYREKTKNRTTI